MFSSDDVESKLQFLGLIVLENSLKPQTTPVIVQLSHARVRTVMATGSSSTLFLSHFLAVHSVSW